MVGSSGIEPDPEHPVLAPGLPGRPAEQLATKPDPCVGPAHHEPVDVDGALPAEFIRPGHVRVRIDGDRRGSGTVIPAYPGQPSVDIRQYPAIPRRASGRWPSPLVGAL